MNLKSQVEKLLERGIFRGVEAGRLAMIDMWMSDNGQESLLTPRDWRLIRQSLRTPQDIEDYNSHISLYKRIDYTLKDVRIFILEAETYFMSSVNILNRYYRKASELWRLSNMPVILTQRQYEELKAEQRPLLLSKPYSLEEVLDERARLSKDDIENEKAWPERWRPAIQEVQELIRAGKLRPFRLPFLDELIHYEDMPEEEMEDYFKNLNLEEVLAGSEDAVEATLSQLDELQEDKLSEPQQFSLLERTYFTGQDLYQASLPEWIEYIDTYHTGVKPYYLGRRDEDYVAIVQNPEPRDLDERGYWKGFEDSYPLNTESHKELLETLRRHAEERIKAALAIQAVLKAIGAVVEINFLEKVEAWLEELEGQVNIYNLQVEYLEEAGQDMKALGLADYQPIKVGRMKPTAKALRHYKERMAEALTKVDWWQEAIETLDYEQAEDGSLAKKIATEIAAELEKMRG
jgi:hypothetical protein